MSPDDTRPTHFRPATYAASEGERPAVITASGRVGTFAELEERSCRLAQALFAHGLRPGDHVAVLLPNDDRTHEVAFALQRSGLYYTMVNTHLTADGGGLHRQRLRRPHPDHVGHAGPAGAELVAPHARTMELRLMMGGPVAARATRPTTSSSPAFPGEPLAEERRGPAMLYSSGTTGHPKGIRRPLSGAALRLRRRRWPRCSAGSWGSPRATST